MKKEDDKFDINEVLRQMTEDDSESTQYKSDIETETNIFEQHTEDYTLETYDEKPGVTEDTIKIEDLKKDLKEILKQDEEVRENIENRTDWQPIILDEQMNENTSLVNEVKPKEQVSVKKPKNKILRNTLLSMCGVFVIAFALVMIPKLVHSNDKIVEETPTVVEEKPEEVATEEGRITFLVYGVDVSERLSDVMMVGAFDLATKEISIMSIPRDTYTTLTDLEIAELNENGVYGVPREMKMNAVNSYGKPVGPSFLVNHLEEFLGIEIDYYAKVQLDGLTELVDALGGVDFYVPHDMKINLASGEHVELQEGQKHLNGKEAQLLVRYRKGYVDQDISRVKVQQDFLKTVLAKLTDLKSVAKNPIEVYNVVSKNVETNFGVTDATKYMKYANGISEDKIVTSTMPIQSISQYVIPDDMALKRQVRKIFYGDELAEIPAIEGAKIQVLNGSQVSRLATKTKEKLVTDGYTVVNIGDERNNEKEPTYIHYREGYDVTDLGKYFDFVEYQVDNTLPSDVDVKIILGQLETCSQEYKSE